MDDIYIAQLLCIVTCYNEVMIYTYRNLYLSFLLIIQQWYIHTKTFIIPCYNKMIIYTYRTFSSSIRVIMKSWYMHTETFFYPSLFEWSDDIYIPQFFFMLSSYNEVMIYTYRNLSLSFLVIMNWWYIHTATFLYLSLL